VGGSFGQHDNEDGNEQGENRHKVQSKMTAQRTQRRPGDLFVFQTAKQHYINKTFAHARMLLKLDANKKEIDPTGCDRVKNGDLVATVFSPDGNVVEFHKMAGKLYSYIPDEGRKKIIFCAHWSYQGGPWYDHALVDYGECPVPKEREDCMDESDIRPSRILAFFKVESHHLVDASLVSAKGWHAVCSRTISPAFFREDENFRNNWNDRLEVQDQYRLRALKEKHAAEQKQQRNKKPRNFALSSKPKNNKKNKPSLPRTDEADKPYPTNYDQCPALFHLSKMELEKEDRVYSFPLKNAQKSKVNENEVIVRGGDNMPFVHGKE